MSKISVIVPVHNTAKYLPGTLESIYGQTFKDIEIILCENCSTDGSYELCDAIAEENPGVKVLHLDRADLSHARNSGVDAASSDVVSFIDSDDLMEPDMLEKMYGAMQKYGVDMVAAGYCKVYDDGRVEYPYPMDGSVVHWDRDRAVFEIISEKISHSACTILCSRRLLEKQRFPENRFFEDNATIYRLASLSSGGMVYINSALYHYMQREGSICHTLDFRKVADFADGYYEKLKFLSTYFSGEPQRFEVARHHNVRRFFKRYRQMVHLAVSPGEMAVLEQMREKVFELHRLGLLNNRKVQVFMMKHFWVIYRMSLRYGHITVK